MESIDQSWLDGWRLKAIATSVAAELQLQFGPENYYTPEQVTVACEARQVAPESRVYALAKYEISDPAETLRKMMAAKISPSMGPEEAYSTRGNYFTDLASGGCSSGHEGGSGFGGGCDGGGGE